MKKNRIIVIIVAVVVIGMGVGWYVYQNRETQVVITLEELLEFEVKNTTLEQWVIDREQAEFEAVKKVLLETPQDFQALKTLGGIKKAIGDFEGAEKAWIRAGQVSPNNSVSFYNLAVLYAYDLPDEQKAVKNFKQALENSDGEDNTYIYRAFYDFYASKQNWQGAEDVLVEALDQFPNRTDFKILLGDLYVKLNQPDKARALYEQALAEKPDDITIKQRLEKLP